MSDDWDEGGTTTASFGGGSTAGSGRGWGRGMGFSDSNTEKKPGFGGKMNGFSSNNNDDDDGWDESNKENSSSFGGGFGNDAPRGGGFGGKSKSFGNSGGGGDRSCYKCGESGHISRDCPSAGSGGGGGGSRACFKCGEDGHISRECPSAGSGGGRGGGSRACFKCGEEGHMSRECPSAGSGGGGGGSRACFKCGEEGHMSRECPSAGSGGGGGGSRACFKCGEEGHMSRECPSAGGGGGGSGGSGCRKCGEDGHFARECPQASKTKTKGIKFDRKSSSSKGGGEGASKGCFNCGSEDHQKKDCTEPPKPRIGEDGKPLPELYIPPAPTDDEGEMFKGVCEGINFNKYDDIPVEVTGRDKPTHIERFEDSGIYETCMNNVRKANYHKPTPIQKYAIPIILKGRDLMACAQTGSGKTAAFLLPIITGMVRDGCSASQFDTISGTKTQTPECVVVAPTRELVVQIYKEARKFSHNSVIRPVVVYGGTSVGHQIRQVEGGTNILVATPGRLQDFVTRGVISFSKCKYLVLDEADRMLDMGFGPVVRKLVEETDMPSKTERNTLMFSATFPEEIQRLAADFLNDYLFVTVGRVGGANTDVSQNIVQVDTYGKREKLCEIISETGTDRTLVFVETKRNADFLASYLSQSGFPTTSVHGDRQQREREDALNDFRTGKAPILVATSVCARGLDIPDVKHVINYDLPSEIEDYVHRIGRTGRCGNIGKATSFFSSEADGKVARQLVKILSDAQQEVPAWLESAAEGEVGTSGFNAMGGAFGGKDVRRGKGGGGGGSGNDDWGNAGMGGGSNVGFSAGGGGGFAGGATNDDEDWD